MKKKIFLVFFLIGLSLLIFSLKAVWESQLEYMRGKRILTEENHWQEHWRTYQFGIIGPGNEISLEKIRLSFEMIFLNEAIQHFRKSLDWNIYHSESKKILFELGDYLKKKGNYPMAIRTYQELRSALYSSRHFGQPYFKVIDQLDHKLSLLDEESFFNFKRDQINSGWAMIAFVNFIAWILLTFLLIIYGFNKEGASKGSFLIPMSSLAIGFFLFWVFSLSRVM